MRVLFDTKIFVSYLLSSGQQGSTIVELFDRAFAAEFTLVVPSAVLEELSDKIAAKPFLAGRIQTSDADALIAAVISMAEIPIHDPIDFVPTSA